jgi:hypothetical protein
MTAFSLSLEITLEPPAMGTHFSGLSLKKWSPGRTASRGCFLFAKKFNSA